MSAQFLPFIISFSAAMSGVILGNMFLIMMIGEINRKRQNAGRMSYFGYTIAKTLRIFREYRALYPGGRLHILAFCAGALMILGLIGGAISLGFLD